MKRVVLLILLVMLVAWFAAVRTSRQHRAERWAERTHQPAPWVSHETRRAVTQARREAEEAVRQAHADVRQALAEAQHELRAAHREVSEAFADAGEEVREAFAEAREDEPRETVEGIPVPIVHGTREDRAVPVPPALPNLPEHPLAEAPAAPPAPPAAPAPPAPPARVKKHRPGRPPVPPAPPAVAAAPSEIREIEGPISSTEKVARDDAREQLDRQVAEWLQRAGVPHSWQPPRRLVDDLIVGTSLRPVVKDYGTLYIATLKVDVSPGRRAGLVQAYQRQLVARRMVLLGGGLAFLLTCLGAVSGYIRADEATRGYYTNRLRLVAAAGVGAAGMALYRMIV